MRGNLCFLYERRQYEALGMTLIRRPNLFGGTHFPKGEGEVADKPSVSKESWQYAQISGSLREGAPARRRVRESAFPKIWFFLPKKMCF